MSCPNRIGVDGDGPRCGDEGRLCEDCSELEERDWEWLRGLTKREAGISLTETELEQERAELRDAGRI